MKTAANEVGTAVSSPVRVETAKTFEEARSEYAAAYHALHSISPRATTRALLVFSAIMRLLAKRHTGRITIHSGQGFVGADIDLEVSHRVEGLK